MNFLSSYSHVVDEGAIYPVALLKGPKGRLRDVFARIATQYFDYLTSGSVDRDAPTSS